MKYLSILLFLTATIYCNAQIIPAENAVINHRLTGFSVPKNKTADSYLFEIATDSVTTEKQFKTNTITKHTEYSNRFIETLPNWGKKYTWRVSFLDKKKTVISKTKFYHFATGFTSIADTSKSRLRVVTNKVANKDMLVFIDAGRGLYDMDGNVVWYLTSSEDSALPQNIGVRDLKITPQHTITYLTQIGIFESTYDGKILWSKFRDVPKGKQRSDTIQNFHHEFTRLHSGNYMAAINEHVYFPLPLGTEVKNLAQKKAGFKKSDNGDTMFRNVECGILNEYDTNGKVKWSWKSSGYFSIGDINSRKMKNNNLPDSRTHMNAFYFDEVNNYIYVSFRDLNRIVKLKYPSGEVITSYGENFVPGEYRQGDGLFNTQHAPRLNADGDLLLFNNNVYKQGSRRTIPSSVQILHEPVNARDTLRKLWEFTCDFDSLAEINTTSGGSVYELKDKSLLVSMGANNRNFIVSRDKEVLWNAFIETRIVLGGVGRWKRGSSYRAYPIEDKKVLEKLIFSEK